VNKERREERGRRKNSPFGVPTQNSGICLQLTFGFLFTVNVCIGPREGAKGNLTFPGVDFWVFFLSPSLQERRQKKLILMTPTDGLKARLSGTVRNPKGGSQPTPKSRKERTIETGQRVQSQANPVCLSATCEAPGSFAVFTRGDGTVGLPV